MALFKESGGSRLPYIHISDLINLKLGSLISFCGLAVLLEFGTMLPKSGGIKVREYMV